MSVFSRTLTIMCLESMMYAIGALLFWFAPLKEESFDLGLFISVIATVSVLTGMLILSSIWSIMAAVHLTFDVNSVFTRWVGKRYRNLALMNVFLAAYSTMLSFAFFYLVLARFTDKAFNQEDLDPIAALYFSIVTFATVGYGDIVPTSSVSRLVVAMEILTSMAYVIFLFSLVGIFLARDSRNLNSRSGG